jgi:hypothetical protein
MRPLGVGPVGRGLEWPNYRPFKKLEGSRRSQERIRADPEQRNGNAEEKPG